MNTLAVALINLTALFLIRASSDDGGAAILGGFFILAVGFLVYFLPAVIAMSRHHHQTASIFVLNFFLGWTVLGWIISLVWSVSAVEPRHAG